MGTKIILVGHPGSARIRIASEYLVKKYLPAFDVTFLNYKGPIEGWGVYVAGYLEYLDDRKIVFALDDYLISGPINMDVFKGAYNSIGGALVCAKLCECSKAEHYEYPCSTQYTIWDREFLISMLVKTLNPWKFEVMGSKILRSIGADTVRVPCIPYFTNSSLSSRWEGVRLDGLNEEDINYIKEHGLIN